MYLDTNKIIQKQEKVFNVVQPVGLFCKSRFSIVTESNRFTTALPMPFDIADALNITTIAAASFHTIRPLFHSLFQKKQKQNNTVSGTSYAARSADFMECPSLVSINSGIDLSTSAVEIAANMSLELVFTMMCVKCVGLMYMLSTCCCAVPVVLS
uniref:Uncharacterized protein n=1 Tax=Glossina palpalis gambiensis TaxID=67801 RepID=A0A1B0BRI2_9MUSC